MTGKPYPISINKSLAFILLATLLILWLMIERLVPITKKLKVSKVRHYQARSLYFDSKRYNAQRAQELKDLTGANQVAIAHLKKGLHINALSAILKRSMDPLKIQASEATSHNEYFNKTDLNISGTFLQPNMFFEKINALNGIGYIIGIDFPIDIKRKPNNSVEVGFTLRHFSIADLNATLK